MVPFAGFEMPVSYAGLKEEHLATRGSVGLFDVPERPVEISGPDVVAFLNRAFTRPVRPPPGRP